MAQTEGTGLFQYLKFGVGAANTGTGIVTGGDLTVNPQPRKRVGIGGHAVRRGGLIVPSGNAEFYLSLTNVALLQAGLRATYPYGALDELVIEGGADEWGRTYSTAVIEEYSIEYARDEGLKASVKWGALSVDAAAGGTQLAEANLNFEDYEFVIELESEEYGVNAVSIKGSNNVTWRGAADTKAAGSLRLPTHYVYGVEDLTVDLTTDRPLDQTDLEIWEDALPSDLSLVLTGTNGAETCTITLVNLQPGEEAHDLVDANTPFGWKQSFIGDTAGSLTVAVTA